MPKPKVLTDPRNPEIEAWLFAQNEETEFCLRLVLNGLSPHVRGYRRYQVRFRELQDKLCKTEDDLARYLRKSEKVEGEIVRALTPSQPRAEAAVRSPRRPFQTRPTLGQLRKETPWLWVTCTTRGCGHHRPVALAPLLIRWGADASSDVLRRSARCTKCGGIGATLQHPSWGDSQIGMASFPMDGASARP